MDHNVVLERRRGFAASGLTARPSGHLIYNNTVFNCANVGTYPTISGPASNPNPAFWTNDVYQYSASNNLYLASSPQTQLVNWTNDNFTPVIQCARHRRRRGHSRIHRRLLGSAPDLGAYEYGGLAWSAGVGSRPALAIASPDNGNLVLKHSFARAADYQLYATTNLASPLDSRYQHPARVSQSMVRDVARYN